MEDAIPIPLELGPIVEGSPLPVQRKATAGARAPHRVRSEPPVLLLLEFFPGRIPYDSVHEIVWDGMPHRPPGDGRGARIPGESPRMMATFQPFVEKDRSAWYPNESGQINRNGWISQVVDGSRLGGWRLVPEDQVGDRPG